MQQKKVPKINRSRKLARGIVNKRISRRKLCNLEIQIPEMKETIIKCTVPVTEVKLPTKAYRKINTKRDLYKIVGRDYKSEWRIVKINTPYIQLDSLINSKIQVTDGKRIVGGVVVRADIVGGGATSPPTEGGLPIVDE